MPTHICKPEPVPASLPRADVVRGVTYRKVRRIAITLALVIALPSLALVALLIGINPLVRTTVEKLGEAATGVPVALEDARVNIIGGAHLTRFSIGSPREFREPRVFRFDRLDAAVSLLSLLSPTTEIQDVLIAGPEITIEFGDGETNWGTLMKQLSARNRRAAPSDKKFIIHRLRITKPLVVVRAPSLPKGVALRLRDIELREIGSAEGSEAPFSLVLATVVQALLTGAIEEWTGIPGELGDILGRETAQTRDEFGKSMPRPEEE